MGLRKSSPDAFPELIEGLTSGRAKLSDANLAAHASPCVRKTQSQIGELTPKRVSASL
jgi:hypothetical protein